eukprot:4009438-Pyramimonas_sp.AAC.1
MDGLLALAAAAAHHARARRASCRSRPLGTQQHAPPAGGLPQGPARSPAPGPVHGEPPQPPAAP